MTTEELDKLCINTIRFLAVDMVEKANSGHPGLPMGAAPMAYVLWTRFLRHNPANPRWWDRDRFVLSAGHGSALLYCAAPSDGLRSAARQLKRFRQWASQTPGHPESHLTPGVEASTGPLGQGVGNALGMAIGEAHLAARYNRPGHELFRHFTYVLACDGDLMEGVQSEASSLAGHLGLGRLIVLYDNNHVTLSATTPIAFTEDVAARYRAYGWHVDRVDDGNDLDGDRARDCASAKDERDRPSLISVRTVIGYGAPDKQGTFDAHGSPLGAEETRKDEAEPRLAGRSRRSTFRPRRWRTCASAIERGRELRGSLEPKRFAAYAREFPELAREIKRRFAGELPDRLGARPAASSRPTRRVWRRARPPRRCCRTLARTVPELVGGSGDLDPSTYTWLKEDGDFESPRGARRDGVQGIVGGGWGYAGRNIHFGVREHAMGAAVNGLVYHGGFIPFGGDVPGLLRLHAPVDPAGGARRSCTRSSCSRTTASASARTGRPTSRSSSSRRCARFPNLLVIRPCDANETRWRVADRARAARSADGAGADAPDVPTLDRARYAPAEVLRRGAYVLNHRADERARARRHPDRERLRGGAGRRGRGAGPARRRASARAWSRCRAGGCSRSRPRTIARACCRAAVTARLAVEAASPLGWERWVGVRGRDHRHRPLRGVGARRRP